MNAGPSAPSILEASGVDPGEAASLLGDALRGADDGEIFLERSESESFVFDDGRLKSAAYDSTEGFGLRVVAGETAGYAHASEISRGRHRPGGDLGGPGQARLCRRRRRGPRATNAKLYGDDDPLASPGFADKVALLQEIDAFARAPRPARGPGDGVPGRRAAGGGDPARRRPADPRRPPPGAAQCADHRREGRPARERLVGRRRPRRLRGLDQPRGVARPGRGGPAPGPGQSGRRPLPGRRDGRGAGAGLERRAAARGGGPRPGGRFQPQGDLGLLRADRRAGGRAGRHGVRRRRDRRAAAAR